jgi:DNA repair exonuclease SbcCD ATPase subunit
MWHLARVHLRRVGHPDARFDPLELDLTYDGRPCDTVWWLENGGGKTSLLSLVFAVLRPAAREFLGANNQRSLTHYVGSGDVAHVALEWQLPADGTLPGVGEDHRLITGLTLEWPELRAQPDNASALVRLQWGFHVVGGFGLDQLPFVDETGRPRRARAFAEALTKELAPVAAAQLHRPDANQGAWHEWLTDKDLDPEVFRYQLEMNRDEGAIAEAFSFPSGDAFVEWALRVAADPELPGKVARTLASVSEQIHRRPELETELSLCDGAAERLAKLDQAHVRHQQATGEVARTREEAARLATSIELAADHAGAARAAADEELEQASAAATALGNESSRAIRLSARWRQLAEQARLRETEQELESRQQRVKAAELAHTAWQSVDLLLAQDRAVGDRDLVVEQLERFEEGLAPLKGQLQDAESKLSARATHVLAELAERAGEVDVARERLREEAADARRRATQLDTDQEQTQLRFAGARSELQELTRAFERAVADHLLAENEDPRLAASRAAGELDRAQTELDAARTERDAAETALDDVRDRVTAVASELAGATAAAERTGERRAQMRAQAAELAHAELLVEATQTEPAEVWAQPEVTLDRLRSFGDDARRRQVDHALTAVEADRILTAVELDGYAPPSPDVTVALEQLRDAGIAAVAGYHYLAQAVACGARAETLAAAPEVAAGIVVTLEDQLEQAAQVLDGFVPAAPLALSVPDALTDPTRPPARRVIPPDPAVYDTDAAEALHERLGADRFQASEAIAEARARSAAIDAAVASLEALHRAWPDPEAVRTEEREAVQARETAQRRSGEVRDELDGAKSRLTRARTDVGPRERALVIASEQVRRLEALAERWGSRDHHETTLRRARHRLEEIATERAELASAEQERAERREKLAEERANLDAQRRHVSDQLSRLRLAREAESSEVADPGGTLEALEATVTDLRQQLGAVRDQHGLGRELDKLDRRLAELSATLTEKEPTVLTRARELLAGMDAQQPASRRAAANVAEKDLHAQLTSVGELKTALEQVRKDAAAADAVEAAELPAWTLVPAAVATLRANAEAEAERSVDLRRQRYEHETTMVAAEESSRQAADRKKSLTLTLRYLTDALTEDELAGVAPEPYDGEAEDADAAARGLISAINTASAARAAADKDRSDAHHTLVQFVRRDSFAALAGDEQPTSKLMRRLTLDDAAAVAADAEDVHDDLIRRATGIRQDLADIDVHRQVLIDQLVGVARDALGLLHDLQIRSRMPDGLADWSKRRFIEIRHDPLPDEPSALSDRIARTVDQIVAARTTPTGEQLLYRATRAAVGDQPFVVRIIKPHRDLRYDRVDITELAGFSGGQKVTAAVALFTTMLNMRATARGVYGYRTTLLLDNPFGKSSADAFVHLQRQVAERLGIQLVFTTAVKDLAALSQFRRVIRLEHRRHRRSGASHVVPQPASQLVTASLSRADEPGDEPAA